MVSAPKFRSQGPGFESCKRQNSAQECKALHCSEAFIIILLLSGYDLTYVDRDIKQ